MRRFFSPIVMSSCAATWLMAALASWPAHAQSSHMTSAHSETGWASRDGAVSQANSSRAIDDLNVASNSAGSVQDGVREPDAIDAKPADTMHPLEPDIRMPQDRDAFAQPPAGYDARKFQIELEPVRDRRVRYFHQIDPYEHIGWRMGSFVFLQQFDVSPVWNSNVFFSPGASEDWLADLKSESRLISDWARHAVELRMVHERSFHRTYSSENDRQQTYELGGRLDILSSTKLQGLVGRDITQESRSLADAVSGTGDRPDVITDRASFRLDHTFNRLTVQLRGSITDTNYDDGPATSTLADRNFKRRRLAVRGQWEFRPNFAVFAEAEGERRDYEEVAASDGLRRDSDGRHYRVGVALGQSGEYLRGEASIGYGTQRPDEDRLADVDTFLLDAQVAWRITPLTSILFDAETAINGTTLAGAAGVVSRRIGVGVRHAIRRNLIGEADVSYGREDYQGASLRERDVTLKAGVEYSVNRHLALYGRQQYTWARSSDQDRNYDAASILVGARIRN